MTARPREAEPMSTKRAVTRDEVFQDLLTQDTYRIGRFIARGGYSEVHEAVHIPTGKLYAVKVLQVKHTTSPKTIERQIREAETLFKLRHPGVVKVHAIGRRPADGVIFMVMDLLVGRTLRQFKKNTGGRVPIPWVLDIMIGVTDGLAAIHEAGIVHRDLKPENIHIGDDGKVCLFDLGAGKFNKKSLLTTGGMTLGTIEYMSPEQLFRPTTIDARSDQFPLGVIAYELLSGCHPFEVDGVLTDDVMVLGKQIIFAPHRALREIAPHVPASLCQIVERLLSKDPADRYASAAVLWELFSASLDRYNHDNQAFAPVPIDIIATLAPDRPSIEPFISDVGPSQPASTSPFITISMPPDEPVFLGAPANDSTRMRHFDDLGMASTEQMPTSAFAEAVRLASGPRERITVLPSEQAEEEADALGIDGEDDAQLLDDDALVVASDDDEVTLACDQDPSPELPPSKGDEPDTAYRYVEVRRLDRPGRVSEPSSERSRYGLDAGSSDTFVALEASTFSDRPAETRGLRIAGPAIHTSRAAALAIVLLTAAVVSVAGLLAVRWSRALDPTEPSPASSAPAPSFTPPPPPEPPPAPEPQPTTATAPEPPLPAPIPSAAPTVSARARVRVAPVPKRAPASTAPPGEPGPPTAADSQPRKPKDRGF